MSDSAKKKKVLARSTEEAKKPTATNLHSGMDDEIIVLSDDFDFEGFQVVRREFFAHLREPSVTFNNFKLYVNTACLQRFPGVESVQVLVNQDTKIMALMPCPDGAKDSFVWCSSSQEKRKPKQVTCRLFFAKIADLMGWNPDYRYKILGKLIQANGESLIAFDLTATEVYQKVYPEGEKPKTSRTPVYPAEWQNQFGLPYNEHKQYMQIDIFDGYAVYSIRNSNNEEQASEDAESVLEDRTKR